jgi:DNA-directed RNA polymerase specialized sigma24 family protein
MTKNQKARLKLQPGEEVSTKLRALMSFGEVAKALGCSRQAVQQSERNAFRKIRMQLLEIVKEINPQLHESLSRAGVNLK